MGKSQRTKGAVGEREVFKILNDELGLELKRNLDQYQQSDADYPDLLGFCIEIKRQEQLSLRSWWSQVCQAAEARDNVPCLIYRQSRQPWRVVIPFVSTTPMFGTPDSNGLYRYPDWSRDFDYTQTILLAPMFTSILREYMSALTMEQMVEGLDISH